MFEGRKVSDCIVSIDRYYVCPIVRGKETKSVKFGAKVNNIQIDGISFIEHLSFKAVNEGIRLKDCIRMQQKLMNVRVRCVAADSIYAGIAGISGHKASAQQIQEGGGILSVLLQEKKEESFKDKNA